MVPASRVASAGRRLANAGAPNRPAIGGGEYRGRGREIDHSESFEHCPMRVPLDLANSQRCVILRSNGDDNGKDERRIPMTQKMPRLMRLLRSCGILILLLTWGAACGGNSHNSNNDLVANAFLIQTAEEMNLETPEGQRPRLVLKGVSPTMGSDQLAHSMDVSEWLKVFPFDGADPAKAVLVIGNHATQITLSSPMYDQAAGTLSYEIQVLRGAELPSHATMVQMRLQDCPNQDYYCAPNCFTACGSVINNVGTCWQWVPPGCFPCNCGQLINECNSGDHAECCKEGGSCLPSNSPSMDCIYQRIC
jgi:hypothetical protein